MGDVVSQLKAPSTADMLRFLRNASPCRPSSAGDGRNTVSAGLPGLTPHDRLAVDKIEATRRKSDDALAEKQLRDEELKRDGERDTTSLQEQIGRPFHSAEICKRLERLNSNLVFERSIAFPDIMGIYLPDANAEIRNGRRLSHVTGFEFGFSPEFTVYHPAATGPKKLTRGWRALLLLLASKKVVNLTAACNAFNIEVYSQSSEKWRRELGLDKSIMLS